MGWEELLQNDKKLEEKITFPWTSEKFLQKNNRSWKIEEKPDEPGWWSFEIKGRKAYNPQPSEPDFSVFSKSEIGYIVGNRFLSDSFLGLEPNKVFQNSPKIWLLEAGLERFSKVSVGRINENSSLIFKQQEMPTGPEDEVLQAYLDKKESIDNIKGVTPLLDLVFRVETQRRVLIEKRREEKERLSLLGKRKLLIQNDFAEAARLALSLGGAEFLDYRNSGYSQEVIVKFKIGDKKFECSCDSKTLRIIDSGICLTDEETGEKGDSYFTLESLPAVIIQAERENKLVIFRHAD